MTTTHIKHLIAKMQASLCPNKVQAEIANFLQSQAERIKGLEAEVESTWSLADKAKEENDSLHAKMVPMEKDAARYQEIREALTDLMAWQVKNVKVWNHPTWDNAQAVIDRHNAAMGINRRTKMTYDEWFDSQNMKGKWK